jgi:hypothetical protein
VTRRGFVLIGAGVAVGAASLPYLPLTVGDNFESLVADRLGVELDVANSLLAEMRAALGESEYNARARKFTLAVRLPWSLLVPDGEKGSAIASFVEPLLDPPPARLAYVRGREVVLCGALE